MTKNDPTKSADEVGCGLPCPMCESGSLIARHCKRICLQCGYTESCEDNFLPNQENPVEVARIHPEAKPNAGQD